MFIASYRNTEAGIQRRLDASKPKRLPAHAELAVMRGKIAQLERRIQEIDPKNQERHWADQPPVFKSRFRRIEERACRLFKLSRAELYSSTRQREVSFARQFVMYWAYRTTMLSMPQIGRLMGGRDHTSILHGASIYPRKRALQGRTLKIVANSFKSRKVSLANTPRRAA